MQFNLLPDGSDITELKIEEISMNRKQTFRFFAALVCILWAVSCGKKHPAESNMYITYTLTVFSEEGIDGYPLTGTYVLPEGDTSEYGYRALDDFADLVVTLDGEEVPAEGYMIMDRQRNHLFWDRHVQEYGWMDTRRLICLESRRII
jgi:hypothetical protein